MGGCVGGGEGEVGEAGGGEGGLVFVGKGGGRGGGEGARGNIRGGKGGTCGRIRCGRRA